MQTQDDYDNWAGSYDSVDNKTRDLEAKAIRSVLETASFESILEIGCGTGKNTFWLASKCQRLTAVDFSAGMLANARQKASPGNVNFVQADITTRWRFEKVNLISCSLLLEHVADLQFIFQQAAATLQAGGQFFICELHPYKQLQGSRARFEKEGQVQQLEYFVHSVSDYFQIAKQNDFICNDLCEWYDDDDKTGIPRLVSFIFSMR